MKKVLKLDDTAGDPVELELDDIKDLGISVMDANGTETTVFLAKSNAVKLCRWLSRELRDEVESRGEAKT